MIDPYNFTLPTTSTFQDVLPCVLPFFHIYGLTITLLSKIALGCKLVTLPKFTPDTFLNSLAEHKATVLHLVPPIGEFHTNYLKNILNNLIIFQLFSLETTTKLKRNMWTV